ncbi:MAG: prepilin peptidase [Gemmatimonadetes bacterium]|nr:prepilin peptidase [Gemmatimonadota bacterium]
MGYLVGGGVVWGIRIFGSLAFGKEAMGLGDVHLMAAVGACIGWIDSTVAFFIAAPIGLAWVLISAIFGGNLPTHPWTVNADGRGPAWSNSLFEDNAEFGYGFRLAVDKHREHAGELLRALAPQLGDASIDELTTAPQRTAQQLQAQRVRVGSWLQSMGACTLRRSPWEATMSRRCGRSRRPRSMRARRSSLRTATASPGGSTSPMGCSTSSWLSGPGIGPCTATTPTEVRTVSPDSSSIAWSPRSRSKSTHTVRGVTGSWPTPGRKTPIG